MIKESTEQNKHLSEMNNELFTCETAMGTPGGGTLRVRAQAGTCHHVMPDSRGGERRAFGGNTPQNKYWLPTVIRVEPMWKCSIGQRNRGLVITLMPQASKTYGSNHKPNVQYSQTHKGLMINVPLVSEMERTVGLIVVYVIMG